MISLAPFSLKSARDIILDLSSQQSSLSAFALPMKNNVIPFTLPSFKKNVTVIKRMVSLLVDLSLIFGINLCNALYKKIEINKTNYPIEASIVSFIFYLILDINLRLLTSHPLHLFFLIPQTRATQKESTQSI